MSARDFDPRHLDVEAFASRGGALEGKWPRAGFDRLNQAAHPQASTTGAGGVRWHVRGEKRRNRGAQEQVWLHLEATIHIELECQRCLQAVDQALDVQRSIRFVAGEDAAAALDAESDEDVLALTRALNLHELIEDELLLALPLVPRHEVCPEPLRVPAEAPQPAQERDSPFAVLESLKRPRRKVN